MTAPTLEFDWAGRVNVPLENTTTAVNVSKSILLSLKKHLCNQYSTGTAFHTGGGSRTKAWTVESSSNGVTFGASDNWNSITDIVSASAGSAHSWCVLKFVGPTYTTYLCLDACNATASSAGMIVSYGAFTGGSLTTRPTATTTFAPGTASINPSTSYSATFTSDQTTGVTHNSHFSINETNGMWFFAVNRVSTGIFHTFGHMNLAAGLSSGDTFPLHMLWQYTTTGRGAPQLGPSTQEFVGLTYNGGAVPTAGGLSSWTFNSVSPHASSASFGADPITGEFPCFPLFRYDTAPASKARGYLPDIYLVGSPVVGSAFNVAGTPKFVVLGQCIAPFGSLPSM